LLEMMKFENMAWVIVLHKKRRAKQGKTKGATKRGEEKRVRRSNTRVNVIESKKKQEKRGERPKCR
jgi:hypothetical protein